MAGNTEKAVLAGGCFWGMQDLIRKLPGVTSTRVGYSGGTTSNATYRNHGSHAESIEIEFDPAQTSYRDILEFFFQIHDPTTVDRQGNDIGASYRSAIFYADEDQRRTALDTIAGGIAETVPVGMDRHIDKIRVVERFGGLGIGRVIEFPARRPQAPK